MKVSELESQGRKESKEKVAEDQLGLDSLLESVLILPLLQSQIKCEKFDWEFKQEKAALAGLEAIYQQIKEPDALQSKKDFNKELRTNVKWTAETQKRFTLLISILSKLQLNPPSHFEISLTQKKAITFFSICLEMMSDNDNDDDLDVRAVFLCKLVKAEESTQAFLKIAKGPITDRILSKLEAVEAEVKVAADAAKLEEGRAQTLIKDFGQLLQSLEQFYEYKDEGEEKKQDKKESKESKEKTYKPQLSNFSKELIFFNALKAWHSALSIFIPEFSELSEKVKFKKINDLLQRNNQLEESHLQLLQKLDRVMSNLQKLESNKFYSPERMNLLSFFLSFCKDRLKNTSEEKIAIASEKSAIEEESFSREELTAQLPLGLSPVTIKEPEEKNKPEVKSGGQDSKFTGWLAGFQALFSFLRSQPQPTSAIAPVTGTSNSPLPVSLLLEDKIEEKPLSKEEEAKLERKSRIKEQAEISGRFLLLESLQEFLAHLDASNFKQGSNEETQLLDEFNRWHLKAYFLFSNIDKEDCAGDVYGSINLLIVSCDLNALQIEKIKIIFFLSYSAGDFTLIPDHLDKLFSIFAFLKPKNPTVDVINSASLPPEIRVNFLKEWSKQWSNRIKKSPRFKENKISQALIQCFDSFLGHLDSAQVEKYCSFLLLILKQLHDKFEIDKSYSNLEINCDLSLEELNSNDWLELQGKFNQFSKSFLRRPAMVKDFGDNIYLTLVSSGEITTLSPIELAIHQDSLHTMSDKNNLGVNFSQEIESELLLEAPGQNSLLSTERVAIWFDRAENLAASNDINSALIIIDLLLAMGDISKDNRLTIERRKQEISDKFNSSLEQKKSKGSKKNSVKTGESQASEEVKDIPLSYFPKIPHYKALLSPPILDQDKKDESDSETSVTQKFKRNSALRVLKRFYSDNPSIFTKLENRIFEKIEKEGPSDQELFRCFKMLSAIRWFKKLDDGKRNHYLTAMPAKIKELIRDLGLAFLFLELDLREFDWNNNVADTGIKWTEFDAFFAKQDLLVREAINGGIYQSEKTQPQQQLKGKIKDEPESIEEKKQLVPLGVKNDHDEKEEVKAPADGIQQKLSLMFPEPKVPEAPEGKSPPSQATNSKEKKEISPLENEIFQVKKAYHTLWRVINNKINDLKEFERNHSSNEINEQRVKVLAEINYLLRVFSENYTPKGRNHKTEYLKQLYLEIAGKRTEIKDLIGTIKIQEHDLPLSRKISYLTQYVTQIKKFLVSSKTSAINFQSLFDSKRVKATLRSILMNHISVGKKITAREIIIAFLKHPVRLKKASRIITTDLFQIMEKECGSPENFQWLMFNLYNSIGLHEDDPEQLTSSLLDWRLEGQSELHQVFANYLREFNTFVDQIAGESEIKALHLDRPDGDFSSIKKQETTLLLARLSGSRESFSQIRQQLMENLTRVAGHLYGATRRKHQAQYVKCKTILERLPDATMTRYPDLSSSQKERYKAAKRKKNLESYSAVKFEKDYERKQSAIFLVKSTEIKDTGSRSTFLLLRDFILEINDQLEKINRSLMGKNNPVIPELLKLGFQVKSDNPHLIDEDYLTFALDYTITEMIELINKFKAAIELGSSAEAVEEKKNSENFQFFGSKSKDSVDVFAKYCELLMLKKTKLAAEVDFTKTETVELKPNTFQLELNETFFEQGFLLSEDKEMLLRAKFIKNRCTNQELPLASLTPSDEKPLELADAKQVLVALGSLAIYSAKEMFRTAPIKSADFYRIKGHLCSSNHFDFSKDKLLKLFFGFMRENKLETQKMVIINFLHKRLNEKGVTFVQALSKIKDFEPLINLSTSQQKELFDGVLKEFSPSSISLEQLSSTLGPFIERHNLQREQKDLIQATFDFLKQTKEQPKKLEILQEYSEISSEIKPFKDHALKIFDFLNQNLPMDTLLETYVKDFGISKDNAQVLFDLLYQEGGMIPQLLTSAFLPSIASLSVRGNASNENPIRAVKGKKGQVIVTSRLPQIICGMFDAKTLGHMNYQVVVDFNGPQPLVHIQKIQMCFVKADQSLVVRRLKAAFSSRVFKCGAGEKVVLDQMPPASEFDRIITDNNLSAEFGSFKEKQAAKQKKKAPTSSESEVGSKADGVSEEKFSEHSQTVFKLKLESNSEPKDLVDLADLSRNRFEVSRSPDDESKLRDPGESVAFRYTPTKSSERDKYRDSLSVQRLPAMSLTAGGKEQGQGFYRSQSQQDLAKRDKMTPEISAGGGDRIVRGRACSR